MQRASAFWRFGIQVALRYVRSGSEEQILNVFGWINFAFGLLAALVGVFVLRGVFHRRLSSASTVRFLRWSLYCEPGGAHASDASLYAGSTDLHGVGVLLRSSDRCLA